MLRNGVAGFALVFLVLALFLELRLAFWVSLGIPISFLGALALMPRVDVSINVLSLFGFVLVLGIVVDDAIIVGENIYRHQEEHGDGMRGAIEGAYEIAKPVTFAVLTTVAAFSPLLFVPGVLGKVFRVIPLVVIACLLFSLLESLNILPAHLSHIPKRGRPGPWRRFQRVFANGLTRIAHRIYCPVLEAALRWRYVTASVGVGVMIVTIGMVLSGLPGFRFMPSIEANVISASVTMPQGAPVEATAAAVAKLEAGAARLRRRLIEETGRDYFRHVLAAVGDSPMAARGGGPTGPAVGSFTSPNTGEVAIELLPSEARAYGSEELGLLWRDATAPIPEAVEVDFALSTLSAGSDVDVQLAGPDVGVLRAAAEEVKQRLRGYAGVYEVTDSFRAGKQEMKLGIKPAAENVGLTLESLGRQVLPEVLARYPGVFYSFEGAMAEQRDALGGLQRGFTLALLMIFALLAVPLRSYVQPLIIMSAIPFGLVGAVWGHVFLGLNVSIMSMFGLVALTGVVVNDSLIMVDFINRARGALITLVLVPTAYMILDDIGRTIMAGSYSRRIWRMSSSGLRRRSGTRASAAG